MKPMHFKHLHYLWLSLLVIVLDQVSKYYALIHLADGMPRFMTPVLNFVLAFNTGAAFSFLNNASGWQNTFFILLALTICVCLVVWLLRLPKGSRGQSIALSLIIGGALGNVIDRFNHGFVVDFIDAHIGDYHWPAFNIADSAVSVGVVVLLICLVREKSQ